MTRAEQLNNYPRLTALVSFASERQRQPKYIETKAGGTVIAPSVVMEVVQGYAADIIAHPGAKRQRGVIRQTFRDLGYPEEVILSSILHGYTKRPFRSIVVGEIKRAQQRATVAEVVPQAPHPPLPTPVNVRKLLDGGRQLPPSTLSDAASYDDTDSFRPGHGRDPK